MLDKLSEFADKHDMFPTEGLILAAVSGGADSVCLLTALLEIAEKRGFSVAAVHFNHQLRGDESDRDARFVERFCYDRNVTLYSGGGDVGAFARTEGLGIEDAARRLRYDFFYKTAKMVNAKSIATAHTADDNVETVLLNLTRGAGLNGLGGIPPKRGIVIRPMLTVTRNDVIEFLSQSDIPYVEDSSNNLDIYSRNMIRHRVIPVLRALNPQLAEHIASATALIREDEAYLNAIAEQYIHLHCRSGSGDTCDRLDSHKLAELPCPVSSRVIRLIYGNNLSSGHIAAVLALCASGSVSGEVTLPHGTAYREYNQIVFSHDTRKSTFTPVDMKVDGKTEIPELGLTVKCLKRASTDMIWTDQVYLEKINKSFTSFLFKYDNICGNILIRPRESGDKIKIFGRNGTKTLKKLFIEHRIPLRKRPLVPVIADDKGVLAVYGIGLDKRVAFDATAFEAGSQTLEIIFEETAYEK